MRNNLNRGVEVDDFLVKAKKAGLLEELGSRMEVLKNEERVALIEQIKKLPTAEQAGLVRLGKEVNDARKQLELAEEAYLAATQKHADLCGQLYGANHQWESQRAALENKVREVAPTFMIDAERDLYILDRHARDCFKFREHLQEKNWMGAGGGTVTTNNAEEIAVCRQNIANALDRIKAMMLEAAPLDKAAAEVAKIFRAVEIEAYALGVNKELFKETREPVAQSEIDAVKAPKKRMKLLSAVGA